jgi:hypothetical protein
VPRNQLDDQTTQNRDAGVSLSVVIGAVEVCRGTWPSETRFYDD